MVSTLAHVALAGLVGVALLGRALSARSILVVLVAVALVDADAIVGWVFLGAHRAAFHSGSSGEAHPFTGGRKRVNLM
ncbi:hypothetical protein BRD17_04915 [Halobacteriales archaeon SW_7_68_16]|nr:MAG: hypothetical protein BRD17_04915 [Halobacteriales archaeon SW_7_68_16]